MLGNVHVCAKIIPKKFAIMLNIIPVVEKNFFFLINKNKHKNNDN